MKRSCTLFVFQYLFHGIEPSLYVLGHEQCNFLKCRIRYGKLMNYKENKTNKDLFLKSLEKLFKLKDSFSFENNTVIVNDRLAKHFTNNLMNMVLFNLWSYEKYRARDGILIDHLLPWIQILHSAKP